MEMLVSLQSYIILSLINKKTPDCLFFSLEICIILALRTLRNFFQFLAGIIITPFPGLTEVEYAGICQFTVVYTLIN